MNPIELRSTSAAKEAFVPVRRRGAGSYEMSKRKSKSNDAVIQQPLKTTKISMLTNLLRADAGADLSALMEATGWQAHSVRGAIAGQIKKKLGLSVATERAGGRTIYRIAE
ncbi:MAG: DUF3489 domain-containing protein [Phenylobacterium sp.]|uniref:DUF3489 domain-containing protein n=1 Tax=Phenylobacterium sp. TaxID=1871053 RepID=UPI003BB6CAC3